VVGGEPPSPPGTRQDFLQRVLDLSPGIVFVADATLTVTFVNRAATALLGYSQDELLGRSVLDFIDVDWNPAALASIGTALGSEGGVRPPMTFRVLSKDGRRPIIEATANIQLDDPLIGGFVVYARPGTERWLSDRAFESVAAGDPIDRTLRLLVDVAGAETLEADAAFVFDPVDDAFEHVVSSAALPDTLCGPNREQAPELRAAWTQLLAAEGELVVNLEDLPGAVRTEAEPLGYRSLWASPGDRDVRGVPNVWAIAWRRELHLDADESRTGMMARLATLAGLALGRSRNDERNAFAATHDAMTGLWNRQALYQWLDVALRTDGSAGAGVGVIYFDLDRFKPINDTFGHAAGDRVLLEVSRRLAAAAPPDGRVGRFGGDEFVYVGAASGLEEVTGLAARLAAEIELTIELRSGEAVSVGASTGSAFTLPGGMNVDELVEAADAALYRVKERR
jgi:diguanylate cyclase (GGDEF)-like protein/PAS domain S-box-containing protein